MFLLLDGGAKFQQGLGDLLVCRLEDVDQLPGMSFVLSREESVGDSLVPGTASSTDSMDIVVDRQGEGVVDDIFHFGDIETAGSDISGDKKRATSIFKFGQGLRALCLAKISVNGLER